MSKEKKKTRMNWFVRSVKIELERQNFKVTEAGPSDFAFISENKKGKRAGVYCKPHSHVNAPIKRKLLDLSRKLGLDAVYVASEKYSSSPEVHMVKVVELV